MSDDKSPPDTHDEEKEEENIPPPKRPRHDSEESEGEEKGDKKVRITDPGKQDYQALGNLLHSLQQLSKKTELTTEDRERALSFLSRLLELLKKQAEEEDEEEEEEEEEEEGKEVEKVKVSNCIKLLQIYFKDKLLKSEGINDECNIVNFLEGLEDGSSTKSDQDKVFVFLAPQATELWYRWNRNEQQWEWTPDKENWMLCSRTTVSGGTWKDETPAPANVEIIRYLNTIRPVPSDEQYLQRFDVLAILHNLKALGGGGGGEGGGQEGGEDLIDAILREVNRVKEEMAGYWMNEEFSL